MTPALLLPLGLAALAALIVPLVIHIARRSEQLPTDFAALRWLRQKPRPRSRLRFDEWPLLILRLILLALVALWFARPVLFGAGDKAPYIAVVPGADAAQAQTIVGEGRGHWLAPGFPNLETPRPTTTAPIASLIRQLDAQLPPGAPLTVVTPKTLQGADAERPRLSRPVIWRVVAGAMPARQPASASIPPLSIRTDADHASGVRYLQAAAASWQPAGRPADADTAELDAPLPDARRTLIRLGAGTLPPAVIQWIEAGGIALVSSDAAIPDAARAVVWRDALDRPLIEVQAMGQGRLLRLTHPLTPSETPELLQADFALHLKVAITPPPVQPARVAAADYAPLTGGRAFDPAPLDLKPWLAVLIGLVLLGERWLATRRSRGAIP
ncbi:BatA domain-containing protein [Brevundimonas goettingensis]|uniref:BatA domain-containing protein n=1 Tax=Brevundimonas goettingensis TaxID=2774190 RepID=A0A975GUX0_9CAUL|nr:BatA domain-containing protein [Brevundimonas goettingensis]QTC89874.1 BatA domain-containing protein [Brevundimonas goettingensis]